MSKELNSKIAIYIYSVLYCIVLHDILLFLVRTLLSVTCFLAAHDIKPFTSDLILQDCLPEPSCASPSGISHLGLSVFPRIFVQGALPTWKGILSEGLHELCNGRVDLQVLLKLIWYWIKKQDGTGGFIEQRGREKKKKSEFGFRF